MKQEWTIQETDATNRLDQWLGEQNLPYSRSQIKKAIQKQWIMVNQTSVKPSYRLIAGDVVALDWPEETEGSPQILPAPVSFEVVYEDSDILIINKPQGVVVHPSEGHQMDTLVNGLVYYAKEHHFTLPEGSAWYRPGIVHRLDKDTSGLMVVAKSEAAYPKLIEQFQTHAIHRGYRGLCYGEWMETHGTIDAPIGRDPNHRTRFTVLESGQRAVTHFKQVQLFSGYTLVDFDLETGRTHQIRVHTAFVGHPVADDPLYATNRRAQFFTTQGQLLHAQTLELEHPITHQPLQFTVPLPKSFQSILDRLE